MIDSHRAVQRIIRGMGAFAVGVTFVLFGTGSRITSFNLGPLSVSAWITIVIPVIFAFVLLFSAVIMVGRMGIRLFAHSLLAAGTGSLFLLLFAVYSIVALAAHWRFEGAQNVLSFGLFALGIFAWAMTFPERKVALTWDVVVYVALGQSIFVMLIELAGWNLIDQRSFAMTAVIGLAAAVTVPAKNLFLRFAPYFIFLSIVLSSSRTTTFAALVMMGLVAFRTYSQGLRRVLGIVAAYVFGLLTILVVYSQYGPAKSRLIAGDGAIKIPSIPPLGVLNSSGEFVEPATAFVINSNGRFDAWTEFLGMLRTPSDWIFGLGPGASAEYGGKHLTYFSQVLNEYLRILIDNGILGLGLFLVAMVGLIVTLLRSQQIPWQYRFGALLTLFSLSVVSFTDGAFIYPFSALPAAMLVGLALSFLFSARGLSLASTASGVSAQSR